MHANAVLPSKSNTESLNVSYYVQVFIDGGKKNFLPSYLKKNYFSVV